MGPGGSVGPGGASGSQGTMEHGTDVEIDETGESAEPFPGFEMGQSESEGGALGEFDSVESGQGLAEDRVEGGMMVARAEPSDAERSELRALEEERRTALPMNLSDVFFIYDSWRISETSKQSLHENADWLKANPSTRLTVEGHCDERGSAAYNLVLGEKRARAVRNYLMELGVSAERFRIVSYGEERPFCRGQSESCYRMNRRGHFVVHAP